MRVILFQNLKLHYARNKVPMVLHADVYWLMSPFGQTSLRTFIEEALNEFRDVYFVSITDIIDWMTDPRTSDSDDLLQVWKCDKYADRRIARICKDPIKKKTIPKHEAEPLFQNGIVSVVVSFFVCWFTCLYVYEKLY
ncbi:hypothetical protein ACOME3_001185 [Neoechinorhynchus agilis]